MTLWSSAARCCRACLFSSVAHLGCAGACSYESALYHYRHPHVPFLPPQASEVLLFNKKLTATEACQLGLVTDVFPDVSFQAEAWARLRTYAKLPRNVGVSPHPSTPPGWQALVTRLLITADTFQRSGCEVLWLPCKPELPYLFSWGDGIHKYERWACRGNDSMPSAWWLYCTAGFLDPQGEAHTSNRHLFIIIIGFSIREMQMKVLYMWHCTYNIKVLYFYTSKL